MRKTPPICQPPPLPLGSSGPATASLSHSPCSCRGRRRNRESGEKGSHEKLPRCTPTPLICSSTHHPPGAASPPLTEFPLGLAQGPRTPGPLEDTVGGPQGEARWYTAPHYTFCDLPHSAPRAPKQGRRAAHVG